LFTGVVETANVPLDWPCAIVMLPGTVADPLLLSKFTSTPPAGAGDANVTVPLAPCPPITLEGLMLIPAMIPEPFDGARIMLAVNEFAEVAVIVGVVVALTAVVVIAKFPTV
jgi:hypothetical protein